MMNTNAETIPQDTKDHQKKTNFNELNLHNLDLNAISKEDTVNFLLYNSDQLNRMNSVEENKRNQRETTDMAT